MDLADKNVVFVAGLGGIGYETCKELMTRNIANLAVLDKAENPEAIEKLRDINKKTNVFFVHIDVTKKEIIKVALAEVVKQIQFINVLVNGAGVLNDRNVELTINVNLIGLINTTLEVLPYMDKRKGGRGGLIANIASVAGLSPFAPAAIYSASKFGVIGFIRSLGDPHHQAVTGVSVMAICPGLTKTPMAVSHPGHSTFDYSTPIPKEVMDDNMQSAETCGKHFVKAMEANVNGSVWIIDRGSMHMAEHKVYWQLTS